MKMCEPSSMCLSVIDACMIFVNLNIKKMDITIWKIGYFVSKDLTEIHKSKVRHQISKEMQIMYNAFEIC